MSIKEAAKKVVIWARWLGRWLSDVIVWIGQLRIWGIAVFGVTNLLAVFSIGIMLWLLIFFGSTCLEQEIRLSGLVLQLFGVSTVAIRLRAARGQFQLPATLKSIRQWWQRRPRFGPQHQVIAAALLENGDSFASARARVSPGPATPLDRRVELLERNYASLFDEVGALDQAIKKNAREFSENLKAESVARQNADKKNEEQLKEAVVGRLHLDYAGVAYLVIGILTATASVDIARLLGAAPCN